MMANCTNGFSSDNLLRYAMPVGPLNESPGMDCYFHQTAFTVLSASIVAYNAVFLLLLAVDLPRKHGWIMQLAQFGLAGSCVSNICVCLFGVLHPEWCRASWAAMTCFCVVWIHSYCLKLFEAAGLILRQPIIETFGVGRTWGWILVTMMHLAGSSMSFGAIMAAEVYDPSNEQESFHWMQLSFSGMFIWSLGVTTAFIFVLNKLQAEVMIVQDEVHELRAHTQSESMLALKEMIARWRSGHKALVIGLPFALIWSALHCFVLPVYWFMLIMYMITTCGILPLTAWYVMTPLKSRQVALQHLCVIVRYRASSSRTSGRVGGSALSSKHTAPSSFPNTVVPKE